MKPFCASTSGFARLQRDALRAWNERRRLPNGAPAPLFELAKSWNFQSLPENCACKIPTRR